MYIIIFHFLYKNILTFTGNKIVINQSQEVPKYSCTYEIELEDVQLDDEIKVYVIDSGEYFTMLFPSEY
ncbi:MAG: DUF960 family protein [Clostridium sp.]